MRHRIPCLWSAVIFTVIIVQPPSLVAQREDTWQEAPDTVKIPAPILTTPEHVRLNKLLSTWYLHKTKRQRMIDRAFRLGKTFGRRERDRLQRQVRESRKTFYLAVEMHEHRVGSLLRHFGDLMQITKNSWPVSEKAHVHSTQLEAFFKDPKKAREKLILARRLPMAYRTNIVWPLIYCLPDMRNGTWIDAKSYLESNYPRSKDETGDSYVLVCPEISALTDRSGLVDSTKPEKANRALRIDYDMRAINNMFVNYRIDTDRVYLTAEGASTPFAVSVASHAPHVFAGLILVNPVRTAQTQLVADNLSNLPVLVLYDKEHAPTAKLLASKLALCQLKSVKCKSPTGSYATIVKAWAAKIKRNYYPKRVVMTQSRRDNVSSYWVEIEESNYSGESKHRPHIEASYHRSSNKITIRTRHVSRVRILLNDLMIDLDKEVKFDLNGSIYKTRLFRYRSLLWDTAFAWRGKYVNTHHEDDSRILFVSSISLDLSGRQKHSQH